MYRTILYLAVILLALIGCGRQMGETAPSKEEPAVRQEKQDYQLSVQTKMEKGQATFVLLLENQGEKKLILTFPTAQQAEFIVEDAKSKELYRYSKGKMFTQQQTTVQLEPGEQKEWRAVWNYGAIAEGEAYQVSAGLLPLQVNGKQADQSKFTATAEFKGGTAPSAPITVQGKDGVYMVSGPAMPEAGQTMYTVEDGHNELVPATRIDVSKAWRVEINLSKAKLPQNGTLLFVLQVGSKDGKQAPKQQEFVLQQFP
ncbi:BsuPI-related putative proteinase inhibitor [Ectobacillus ponti]|uniref:Intracellular proteinase inhibitor BsuPI domain-containing protein n=1 Tax=Ectobacillus ponti TaxID=2961894 RepID=A0AA41X1W5_9BACI|nr:BsuPI-related putative proteinase inhibitor [Ectobacillus ponti]MCP8967082.1 BsuPI-related putative proteinase inhibitor [Ectobacillus ponti]